MGCFQAAVIPFGNDLHWPTHSEALMPRGRFDRMPSRSKGQLASDEPRVMSTMVAIALHAVIIAALIFGFRSSSSMTGGVGMRDQAQARALMRRSHRPG
jgi:hypothetical protein